MHRWGSLLFSTEFLLWLFSEPAETCLKFVEQDLDKPEKALGTGSPDGIQGWVNGQMYCDISDINLAQVIRMMKMKQGWIFQKDIYQKHTAQKTLNYLQR